MIYCIYIHICNFHIVKTNIMVDFPGEVHYHRQSFRRSAGISLIRRQSEVRFG